MTGQNTKTNAKRYCWSITVVVLGVATLWLAGIPEAALPPVIDPNVGVSSAHATPPATTTDTEVDLADDGQVSGRKSLPGVDAPYRLDTATVGPGSTVARTLQNLGVTAGTVASLTAGVKPLYNLARVSAGTPVTVAWGDETTELPQRIELKISDTRTVVALKGPATGDWRAEFRDATVVRRTAAYSGVVTSNLWSSAAMAGMDPQLIQRLAEVFAWQIDFNREVQQNDRWRLTVEQLYVKGEPVGFGEILAAEYENVGVVSTAVRYEIDGRGQYFTPAGESLRRMFLKSPLKFGRITSGFTSRRFHPVLKVNRPHNGVDYGAPTGTPVMSVGDGIVKIAANRGGSGNMISIRHNGVYDTEYKHLSSYASGIKAGARVDMGQVIGYVGATGLATGPHLHFELHENGRYVDPTGIKFPTANPVPEGQLTAYGEHAQTSISDLPPWSEGTLSQKPGSENDDTARRNE